MSAPATHVEDQLLDFAYGELSERDAQSVQAHLSSCSQCQASLDDIQGVRKVMSKLPPSNTRSPSSIRVGASPSTSTSSASPVSCEAFSVTNSWNSSGTPSAAPASPSPQETRLFTALRLR